MMEGDVRKKGMLYQQQNRFGKKWKKVWAEAVADSTNNISCLELYEFSKSSMKEGKKRVESKKVIAMRDCVKIIESEAEGCPKECNTFHIETADKNYTFASPNYELQSWITELCKLAFPLNQAEFSSQKQDHQQSVELQKNTLYGTMETARDFLVIAMATEATSRCMLYGEYFLTPQYDSLLLKDYKTKQVLLTWPYRFVRKFGQDMLSFNFEAGRRCETGEGYFEFATSHSDQLFAIISNALEKLPKAESSGLKPTEQQIIPNSQKSYTPPTQMKSQKKKLTSSYSLNLDLSDNFSKDSNVKNISSTPPPLSSNAHDPIYAIVSRPKDLHLKGNMNHKNQQHGPVPDVLSLSGDPYKFQENDYQMSSGQLPSHSKFKDLEAETVYSEIKCYDHHSILNEPDDDVEDECIRSYKKHSPSLLDRSDLNDSQAGGFIKNDINQPFVIPSHFLKPSEDIPCMDENEQMIMSMEQITIQTTPNVYKAENMYSQETEYYDDYGDNGEFLENMKDREHLYASCTPDTFYRKSPSNLEESQCEGFSTYDNLPKRL